MQGNFASSVSPSIPPSPILPSALAGVNFLSAAPAFAFLRASRWPSAAT